MSSSQMTVEFIVEQIARAGSVSARKMFGEYAIYCDGKMVALVCDDQLFVKPTAAGRALAKDSMQGAPYIGAKPYLVIAADRWDDADWLSELIKVSAAALPSPVQKLRKRR